eukprot:6064565-Amphidinium_carterae.1
MSPKERSEMFKCKENCKNNNSSNKRKVPKRFQERRVSGMKGKHSNKMLSMILSLFHFSDVKHDFRISGFGKSSYRLFAIAKLRMNQPWGVCTEEAWATMATTTYGGYYYYYYYYYFYPSTTKAR